VYPLREVKVKGHPLYDDNRLFEVDKPRLNGESMVIVGSFLCPTTYINQAPEAGLINAMAVINPWLDTQEPFDAYRKRHDGQVPHDLVMVLSCRQMSAGDEIFMDYTGKMKH